MRHAVRHHAALALLLELFLAPRGGFTGCCRRGCSLLWFFGQSAPPIETRLLAGHDFLLRSHGALARTLAGARVGVRALAVDRQIAPMAQSAVALNFNQPADIHLDLLAEIAFHSAFGLDGLTKLVNFFLGQVLDLLGFIDLALAQSARARCCPMP